MDNIEFLKQKCIQFNSIDEKSAQDIMEKEYPCYKLYEYSSLFNNIKNLDFALLYYLAILDEKLRYIVICKCLELEQVLKAIIIHDAEKIGTKSLILEEYLQIENDYLLSHYNSENIDILSDDSLPTDLNDLSFEQFLDVIQFGTFERFLHYFYRKYSMFLYSHEYAPFEQHINSVKHLRNISAHNGSLIGSLNRKRALSSERISSFLGAHGIKHKTLRSNMSKQTMYDLCNFLHVCYLIFPKSRFDNTIKQMKDFLQTDCMRYKHIYSKNSLLVSVYKFTNSVVDIYANC